MLAQMWRSIGIGVLAALILAPDMALAQQADSLLPRAVILTYGRFDDDASASSISAEQFEAHLAELSASQYQVWPLSRLVAAIADGKPIPERTVAITIDEPHASAYTVAWPLLRQYGFPATLFLATDTVDRGGIDTLSWSQIRTMANNGLELGNQTASHPHLLGQDRGYVIGQVARAGERIKAETGTTPTLLAYPYGEYTDGLRDLVKSLGLQGAVGQQSGVAHARSDRYALPRFAMNDTLGSLERFRLAIQALPLLVSDVTPGDMRLAENPPSVGFTVEPMMGDLSGLSCFLSGVGRINLQALGDRRIELKFDDALPGGRSRLNCTLPASEGRWRWFGMMLVTN